MKQSVFTFRSFLLISALILFFFSFTSCGKDDFDPGGGQGSTDLAMKFLGTWHVSDNAARLNYDVTIERNPLNSNTEIFLHNFAGLNGRVTGRIIDNTVVIDKQETGNENYFVEGTGSYINANKLEFTYTLDDNIETEMRNAVFTK